MRNTGKTSLGVTTDLHLPLLEPAVRGFFRDALRVMAKTPRLWPFLLRLMPNQFRMSRRRRLNGRRGFHVPPFMIFSITGGCNLSCKGCYARTLSNPGDEDLSTQAMKSVLEQAQELGISISLIAGGEPLLRKDLLPLLREFPHMVFAVFTNGLLIDAEVCRLLRKNPHCIPIVSIEGTPACTDERRGAGVSSRVLENLSRLRENGIFFGLSVTVTRDNFTTVTGSPFIAEYIAKGCRLFFFVEYVPVASGTEEKVLTAAQRYAMTTLFNRLLDSFDALFIAFPGDEEKFGGCLAAGRGFIHINHRGGVEPCPFAPYSDRSLAAMPLREALASPLLRKIRENHHLLEETGGGCALWENREMVERLASAEDNRAPVPG